MNDDVCFYCSKSFDRHEYAPKFSGPLSFSLVSITEIHVFFLFRKNNLYIVS